MKIFETENLCENGIHHFVGRFDEEVIRMNETSHETHIARTYLFDICTECGKIIYPETIYKKEEEKKK